MEAQRAIQGSTTGSAAAAHVRHRPEHSLLYQIIEQYYPFLLAHLAASGRTLPHHVRREFEDYLKCGRLEYDFLRVRARDAMRRSSSHLAASAADFVRVAARGA